MRSFGAQLKRPTEHLRRIDKRIAMHHAISSKLGILKTGDHAEYALLLGKREVGLEADQIEGTTNVLKGTAELLVVTELADQPDYWFLLATQKALKPIIYQKRKPIKLTSKTNDNDDNVFMKDQFLWGADGRSNAGYGFWQMAYGSTGTTSSKG